MKPIEWIIAAFFVLACSFTPLKAQTAKPPSKPDAPSASTAAPPPQPTPERPREIVHFLNDARLTAPELEVDTFLRVLETKKVADPVWRKEILDEALRTIDDVQYPVAMRLAYGGQNELNDTLESLKAGAFSRKLDRLSLRARLIGILLESDPSRARNMLFQIRGDLDLKPRSCEDLMTYLPDEIYAMVVKVAIASFSEKQIAEGERALFLLPWLENLQSPTQVYPLIDILTKIKGPAAERQMLLNAFDRAIDRNFKDDRSFTASLRSWPGRLSKFVMDLPESDRTAVIGAFRSMLVKNVMSTRCSDNQVKKDVPLPDYLAAFNNLMPDQPLTAEDLSRADVAGTVQLVHMLQKPAFKNFRDEVIATKDVKVVDNKLVKHDQSDPEWLSRVNAFLDRMMSLDTSTGGTEAELLFLKSAAIGAFVADAVDAGDLRKSLVRKYVRVLANSDLQKTSFIEWNQWVAGMEAMAPDDFAEVAGEFPNVNLKVIVARRKLGLSANDRPGF